MAEILNDARRSAKDPVNLYDDMVWRGLLSALWGGPVMSKAEGPEDLAPIGVAGPLKYVHRVKGGGAVGSHEIDWAPTQEALDKYAGELRLVGNVGSTEPSVMKDVLFYANRQPGAPTEMIKIGWGKLRQFYDELRTALEKRGINTLEFEPFEGQLNYGPDVPAEVRKRLFERLAGSKAIETAYGGQYRLPVSPPKTVEANVLARLRGLGAP